MAAEHIIGTPMGRERKQRRMHSPLQEMDDVPPDRKFLRQPCFDVEPKTPEPTAPRMLEVPATPVGATAEPLTLEAIGQLLKAELQPVTASVRTWNAR